MIDDDTSHAPEGSLKALRFIFFAMILILIGGAIFLFVTIYERNQAKTTLNSCKKGIITLPVREEAAAIHQEGQVITILSKPRNDRQEITVFNYCNAKVIRRVVLQTVKE